MIRTNLKSVFLFGRAAGRHMASRQGGAIINMSSTSVVMTMPALSAYAASKGGISSLTRAIAIGLAKHGIRVNAIGPGTILTELNRNNLMSNANTRRNILSRTPLKRLARATTWRAWPCSWRATIPVTFRARPSTPMGAEPG